MATARAAAVLWLTGWMRRCLRATRHVQGDLIPWTIGQQYQDPEFPSLSGARIVRIAVHPELPRAGYGSRCAPRPRTTPPPSPWGKAPPHAPPLLVQPVLPSPLSLFVRGS